MARQSSTARHGREIPSTFSRRAQKPGIALHGPEPYAAHVGLATAEMAVLAEQQGHRRMGQHGDAGPRAALRRRSARSAGAGAVGRLVARRQQPGRGSRYRTAATGWNIPIGKPLYQTGGWIGHPRVSPKGDYDRFRRSSFARGRQRVAGDRRHGWQQEDFFPRNGSPFKGWPGLRMERKSGSPPASRARIALFTRLRSMARSASSRGCPAR